MIGDTDVLGKFYANLDDKNRLCLPAKSGVEENEEILILAYAGARYVVSKHYFDEYLANIKQQIKQPVSKEQLRDLWELYEELCGMVIKSTRADKQHRILVSDVYKSDDGKVEMMGLGKVIKLK